LDHLAVTGAAEFEDLDHIQRVAVYKDQARGFDGHVRAAADGNAHVRAGEGRRVVHAIADHCHALPIFAIRNFLIFVFRQDFREDTLDAQLIRDRFATERLSPVSMATSIPILCNSSTPVCSQGG
jgi:hypothetical protein